MGWFIVRVLMCVCEQVRGKGLNIFAYAEWVPFTSPLSHCFRRAVEMRLRSITAKGKQAAV